MDEAPYLSRRMAALDPAAAHERLSLLQHLRSSAALVGSTDGTSYTCPPRLHRWCAAAAALAIAPWALLLVHLTGCKTAWKDRDQRPLSMNCRRPAVGLPWWTAGIASEKPRRQVIHG